MFDRLASSLLDHVWDGLTDEQRRAVNYNKVVGPAGGPAWDCAMLFVSLSGITPRLDASGCVEMYHATFRVGLLECVAHVEDSGRVPTPAQVTEDGLSIASKVEPLLRLIESFDYEPLGVHGHSMSAYEPLGPSGGLAGGQWYVTYRGQL